MPISNSIPESDYGIALRNISHSTLDEVVEQVGALGYAIIDSGYTVTELENISDEFDRIQARYVELHGESKLKGLGEFHTIRSPLTFGSDIFLRIALNENLIRTLKMLISGKFILNQQNGVINPPQEGYGQGKWHRDLPYQHFISSRPLAINALFCVDNFTFENGATFVIPASHKVEAFPSKNFIQRNAVQIEAKAGSFILLDCMMFHAGGFNNTKLIRRAVNQSYNIPYFKQQINLPLNMKNIDLSDEAKDVLGFNYMEPHSVEDYFAGRMRKV